MSFAQKQLFGVLAIACVYSALRSRAPTVHPREADPTYEFINAEECLAREQKLSARHATQGDLELIRGLSEVKARSIQRYFSRDGPSSRNQHSANEWQILADIKGVGEKGARELARVLSTDDSTQLCVNNSEK